MTGELWFITPAWRRLEISEITFAQRRRAMDALAEMGIDSRCVVVADDENLDLARAQGFDVVKRDNSGLGRKFNDGMEYAGRHGARWIVPIGSDSWIDPAYFRDLPLDGSVQTSHLYAVAEGDRLAELKITTPSGVGPYVFPAELLAKCRYRPADDHLMRGIDGSTIAGIEAAAGPIRWRHRDLHPLQYVGLRGIPQINDYERLRGRWGVREWPDPWRVLAEPFGTEITAAARHMYFPDGRQQRALIYANTRDTNGNGYRLFSGFGRVRPEWQVDLVALQPDGHPEQHTGTAMERKRTAERLASGVDVLHLFNGLQGWADLGRGRGTPVVVHHHGTAFRRDHERINAGARAIGAVQVASTIDLTLMEPNVAWLPAAYDLDELAAIRAREYQPHDRIRVAHAPSSRKIKGTDAVLAAVEALGVEFDLIEGRPWDECLARIARADIVVDQLALGYGSLAVEAWGMGIPVVAGIADEATRAAMLERWGALPFVDAAPDTLTHVLRRLVKSSRARADAASTGHAHAERYHDERVVIPQLVDVYESAPSTRRPVSTWRGVKPWRSLATA